VFLKFVKKPSKIIAFQYISAGFLAAYFNLYAAFLFFFQLLYLLFRFFGSKQSFGRYLYSHKSVFASIFLTIAVTAIAYKPVLASLFYYLRTNMSSHPFQPEYPQLLFRFVTANGWSSSFLPFLFSGVLLLGWVVSFKKKWDFYWSILLLPFVLWGISTLRHYLIMPRFTVWILPYFILILCCGIDFLWKAAPGGFASASKKVLRTVAVTAVLMLSFFLTAQTKKSSFYPQEMEIAIQLRNHIGHDDVIFINAFHSHLMEYLDYYLGKEVSVLTSRQDLNRALEKYPEVFFLFRNLKVLKRLAQNPRYAIRLKRALGLRNSSISEYHENMLELYNFLEKNAASKEPISGQYTLYRLIRPSF
jgi:hypothetical protein